MYVLLIRMEHCQEKYHQNLLKYLMKTKLLEEKRNAQLNVNDSSQKTKAIIILCLFFLKFYLSFFWYKITGTFTPKFCTLYIISKNLSIKLIYGNILFLKS